MDLKTKLQQFLAFWQFEIDHRQDYNDDEIIDNFIKHFPDYRLMTELKEDGTLLISPSNELEIFSLKMWMNALEKNTEGCTIAIDLGYGNKITLDRSRFGMNLLLENKQNGNTLKETVIEDDLRFVETNPKKVENKTESFNKNQKYVPTKEELLKCISESDDGLSVPDIAEIFKDRSENGVYNAKIYHILEDLVNAKELVKIKDRRPFVFVMGNSKTIPLKESIIDVMSKKKIPMLPMEIQKVIESKSKKEIKEVLVYNTLVELKNEGKVRIEKVNDINMWVTADTVKTANSQIYASDSQRVEFAKDSGYKTIDEAIREMGSWEFEKKLKEWVGN